MKSGSKIKLRPFRKEKDIIDKLKEQAEIYHELRELLIEAADTILAMQNHIGELDEIMDRYERRLYANY